jgi:hypothetical protein
VIAAVACALAGCATLRSAGSLAPAPAPERPPDLTTAEITELVPERVPDRRDWGEAIQHALTDNRLAADRTAVCAVIAIVGQESGFQADPIVPGLARIARARIDRYKAKLGPLGDPLFDWMLAGHAPADARPFSRRLDTVHTERDVDLLFRDLLAYYQADHPALFEAASWAGKIVDLDDLADLNPITTAGSMQVSVRFATQWAREHGASTATDAAVRDALYTRAGGVYFGAARLLGFAVHYDRPLYRFADYNAGYYASRNAAVQAQIANLTGLPLAADGDLLAYDRNGTPSDDDSASERAVQVFASRFAPRLTNRQIRRDLLEEKTLAFEDTDTYRAITAAAASRGRPTAYAMLPEVALQSPKLTRPLTTAWFARAVDRRYQACLTIGASRDVSAVEGQR